MLIFLGNGILFALAFLLNGSVVEYLFHKIPMHNKVNKGNLLFYLSRDHIEHHRVCGKTGIVKSGLKDDKGVVFRYENFFWSWVLMFPSTLCGYYFFGWYAALVSFIVHMTFFTWALDAHIATHYSGNKPQWCPKWYFRVWKDYHLLHHVCVDKNFNFVYLFISDFLFGTLEWRNRDVYLQSKVH